MYISFFFKFYTLTFGKRECLYFLVIIKIKGQSHFIRGKTLSSVTFTNLRLMVQHHSTRCCYSHIAEVQKLCFDDRLPPERLSTVITGSYGECCLLPCCTWPPTL